MKSRSIIDGIMMTPIIVLGAIAHMAMLWKDWRRRRIIKTVYGGDERAYLYDKWKGIAVSRYAIRRPTPARSWWDTPAPPLPHPQSYVSDPVKTGVLDADGNEIYRMPDPVGFLRPKDDQ